MAIVDDSSRSATEKLAAALNRAKLWTILRHSMADRAPVNLRIVVKPELAAFSAGSLTTTDPLLFEDLVDLLYNQRFSNAAIVGTCDGSAVWDT